jgi:hypothetical protein
LESTPQSVGIDVVVDTRAAHLDRAPEHARNRLVEPNPRRFREFACRERRADPRFPQRFTSVDVPDPRDAALIEEKNLDGGRSPRQKSGKTLVCKFGREWFQTEVGGPRLFLLDEAHPAERSHVGERKCRTVGERQQNIRIRQGRLSALCCLYDESPGHPKMNGERAPALERDDHELPAPSDAYDAIVCEGRLKWAIVLCNHDPRKPDIRFRERLAGDRAI